MRLSRRNRKLTRKEQNYIQMAKPDKDHYDKGPQRTQEDEGSAASSMIRDKWPFMTRKRFPFTLTNVIWKKKEEAIHHTRRSMRHVCATSSFPEDVQSYTGLMPLRTKHTAHPFF